MSASDIYKFDESHSPSNCDTANSGTAVSEASGDFQSCRAFLSSLQEESCQADKIGDEIPEAETDSDIGSRYTVSDHSESEAAEHEATKHEASKNDTSCSQLLKTSTDGIDLFKSQNQQLFALLSQLSDKIKHEDELEPLVREIKKIEGDVRRPNVVISVVGQTGAGKSSLINALLDMERITPTNGHRACTAVITEIAWNEDSTNPFKAEFEFLTSAEWHHEIDILLQDLQDDDGDQNNPDSAATITMAKLKALCPSLGDAELKKMTAEQLLDHGHVASVLDKTVEIKESNAKAFYNRVKPYIDAQNHRNAFEIGSTPAFWPVVRLGRIYIQAEVLSTGAILVDLPGMHDSNAARGAIAMDYLLRSSFVCIVANSKRSIHDKSAGDILGQTLKRHLQFNGSFDRVIWVNSHSDDFDVDEVAMDLEVPELEGVRCELEVIEGKLEENTNRRHNDCAELRQIKTRYKEKIDTFEDFKKLQMKIEAGEPVYEPDIQYSRKRKCTELEQPADKILLTEANVQQTIEQACAAAKTLHKEMQSFETAIDKRLKELKKLKAKKQELDKRCWNIAMKARNRLLVEEIKAKYVSTVMSLDEEARRTTGCPEVEFQKPARDYQSLHNNFTVFCISSKGYQRLLGQKRQHNTRHGFSNFLETGIPLLRSHLIDIAQKARACWYKQTRGNLLSILTSVRLWGMGSIGAKNLTEDQLSEVTKLLNEDFRTLYESMELASKAAVVVVTEDIRNILYPNFLEATEVAERKAYGIQQFWSSAPNRGCPAEGGLYWGEYRVTARRHGEYSNHRNTYNFNLDLWNPFLDSIAHKWDQVLRIKVETSFEQQIERCTDVLQEFHDAFERRALKPWADPVSLQLIRQQLPERKDFIRQMLSKAKETILQGKMIAYREPIKTIQNDMVRGYNAIGEMKGDGVLKRMREAMEAHVKKVRRRMYKKASDTLCKKLDEFTTKALQEATEPIKDYLAVVFSDYESVTTRPSTTYIKGQLDLRKEVSDMINRSNIVATIDQTMKLGRPFADAKDKGFFIKCQDP